MKNVICMIIACSIIGSVCAEDEPRGESYVEGPIIGIIGDTQAQARDWAMCSATYDVMAEIYSDSQPATSKQMSQLGNGAQLAVAITIAMGSVDEDVTPESFNSSWEMGKVLMDTMVDTASTSLLADLERMSAAGNSDQWMADIAATLDVCMKNLEMQQMKIDAWRELAAKGVVTVPDK